VEQSRQLQSETGSCRGCSPICVFFCQIWLLMLAAIALTLRHACQAFNNGIGIALYPHTAPQGEAAELRLAERRRDRGQSGMELRQ
jgi:hypothetical protein